MEALILVDIQNDFMPGGALAVREGNQVVPVANRLARSFDLVVATQDWHPPNHGSFGANHEGKTVGDVIDLNGLEQILWPVHCVQGTPGAELHADLERSLVHRIFHKGTDPGVDSYSAFFDNARRKATGLGSFLKDRKVDGVYLLGLATDYCVKFSALDALELGFAVRVVEDGCRGVNLKPGDSDRALEEIKAKGGKIVGSE